MQGPFLLFRQEWFEMQLRKCIWDTFGLGKLGMLTKIALMAAES